MRAIDLHVELRRRRLKFAVKARNALGFGQLSAKSNAVRPR